MLFFANIARSRRQQATALHSNGERAKSRTKCEYPSAKPIFFVGEAFRLPLFDFLKFSGGVTPPLQVFLDFSPKYAIIKLEGGDFNEIEYVRKNAKGYNA